MKNLIVIAGPTASGKTAVAIALASHYSAPILSADSRQFYALMDIGTAKPGPEELARVPHLFIGFLRPDEYYNIGRFESDALEKLSGIFESNDIAFMTGGSGLYIQSVCSGLDELP